MVRCRVAKEWYCSPVDVLYEPAEEVNAYGEYLGILEDARQHHAEYQTRSQELMGIVRARQAQQGGR